MFKKVITYFDYDGNKQTETFYFHMSKTDLIEMAAGGDLQERLERIIGTKDNQAIFRQFKDLVRMAAGRRMPGGKIFDKSPEAKAELMDSPAFDELVLELCTSPTAASEFVKNLIPEQMQKELQERLSIAEETDDKDPFVTVEGNKDERPAWEREDRDPTEDEVVRMPSAELQRAFKRRIQQKAAGTS